ncbi:response regulator [Acidobacterium sp. S8]|uniref:response regulator n=1 Tax=Acidobacterium sp. S8 TaxID=1641854 RepID=UPI00131CB3BA|nr:response regulator [Acidobacterium sp. S8]
MRKEMNDIVVVDDNPAIRYGLSEIFKRRGYIVRTASDGFSALALIRERIPGILLSDLDMPGMSGFELLSVVRRRFPAIAVIAMSGAYSGVFVPPDVAADAFYAKGSNGAARLFEILWSIEERDSRESLRQAAPIWIPDLPARECVDAGVFVSCPECLRSFFHPVGRVKGSTHLTSCSHCFHPVQLAIVTQPDEMDTTSPGLDSSMSHAAVSIDLDTESISELVGQ